MREEEDYSGLSEFQPHQSSWISVILAFLVVSSIVLFGSLDEKGDFSWKKLESSFVGIESIVDSSGWAMMATAVALVAIAITAVAILGISPTRKEDYRRQGIMQICDWLLTAALGFLMICCAMAFIGYIGRSWENSWIGPPIKGTGMLFIGGSAMGLWLCIKKVRDKVIEIFHSDDVLKRKFDAVQQEKWGYTQTLRTLTSKPAAKRFPDPLKAKAAIHQTICISVALVISCGVGFMIIAFIWNIDKGILVALWQGTKALPVVWLMSAGVMASFVIPLLWIGEFKNTGRPGWLENLQVAGSLILVAPFSLAFPVGIILGAANAYRESPWRIAVILVLIALPTVVSFVGLWGRSWRTVSTLASIARVCKLLNPVLVRHARLRQRQHENLKSET